MITNLLLRFQEWLERRADELTKAKLKLLRSQMAARASQPVHAAEILGTDSLRRRYFAFAHDPFCVWVEVPLCI